MANSWFRMYAEFAHDPKVQMLSEADQRRYIMLLCMRCSNADVTLHVTSTDTEVAFQLRISDEEWRASKVTLMSRNLIDEHNNPVAWEKRQYVSDSSRERVSRHRANKKNECNANVTLQQRSRNAVDTDTDTDTDKEKTTPKPPTATPVGFAEFWAAYPKKVGKGAAESAWKKHRPDLKTCLAAIGVAAKSDGWTKERGKFIPHPSRWLNERRWEDGGQELKPVRADGKPIRDPMIYGFDVANGDPLPDGWKLPPTGETRYMAGIGWVLSSPKPKDKPLRVVA